MTESEAKEHQKKTTASDRCVSFQGEVSIVLPDHAKISYVPRKVEMEEVVKKVKLNGVNKAKTDTKAPLKANQTLSEASGSTIPGLKHGGPDNNGTEDQKDEKTAGLEKTKETAINKELRPKRDQNIRNTKAYWSGLRHYNQKHGTRRYIEFVIPLGPGPLVLMFQSHDQNDWILPGGFLNHDETEEDGIKRIWKELFQDENYMENPITGDEVLKGVQFNHFIAKWYRPEHKVNVYPYKLRFVSQYKEIIKVVLAELPDEVKKLSFSSAYKSIQPRNLFDIYDSKNPEINSIPSLLSRFDFR